MTGDREAIFPRHRREEDQHLLQITAEWPSCFLRVPPHVVPSILLPTCDLHPAPWRSDPEQSREPIGGRRQARRSEEHTSELQSLMRISYAVICLKKNKNI